MVPSKIIMSKYLIYQNLRKKRRMHNSLMMKFEYKTVMEKISALRTALKMKFAGSAVLVMLMVAKRSHMMKIFLKRTAEWIILLNRTSLVRIKVRRTVLIKKNCLVTTKSNKVVCLLMKEMRKSKMKLR